METIDCTKLKYFLYARRSVEDRSGEKVVSIESQQKELEELAKQKGLKVVGTFTETKSAKEPNLREEFTEMIKQIYAGKANAILVWKMDRLTRNPIDEGTVKYLLQKGIMKNIKATDRDFYPDDNVLLASVEFGVATQYSRDLSKHVKRGLRARLDAGVKPGRVPLGYKNSKYHEKGKEEILVDEERFPLVQRMFKVMATGKYNPLDVLRMANDEWGLKIRSTLSYPEKKISKSSIYSILSNPFYTGHFEFPRNSGNWFEGNHLKMISREEFEKVQEILRKGKWCMRPKTHRFKYTGTIRCGECGAFITAEEKHKKQKNGNEHHYVYYRCTKRVRSNCSQKTITETELEKKIIKYLEKITIPKELHEWALEELKNSRVHAESERNRIISSKKNALSNCQNKLDSLLELRLANELTPQDYAEKKSSLEKEKTEIKEYLDNIDKKENDELKEKEEKLSFTERALREFIKGDDKKKREIFKTIGTKHTLKDRELKIEIEEILLSSRTATLV
ncbi:MAG: recombinase family protein [bacterium]